MRQLEDPEFAATLGRIRMHCLSVEDFDMLNSCVGAHLDHIEPIPMIIRRHQFRHASNRDKMQDISNASGIPMTHCIVTNISNRCRMGLAEVFRLKGGVKTMLGDGTLSVLPDSPLLLTKNICIPLGMSLNDSQSYQDRPGQ